MSSNSPSKPSPQDPREGPPRFVKPWVEIAVGQHPNTMADLLHAFPAEAHVIEDMRRDGIELEPAAASYDLPLLVTTDPAIAAKYDMLPEEDYWNEQEAASE
jgi:hypothetical protein